MRDLRAFQSVVDRWPLTENQKQALENNLRVVFNHAPNPLKLNHSLFCAFVWERTPQGHAFWEKVWRNGEI